MQNDKNKRNGNSVECMTSALISNVHPFQYLGNGWICNEYTMHRCHYTEHKHNGFGRFWFGHISTMGTDQCYEYNVLKNYETNIPSLYFLLNV